MIKTYPEAVSQDLFIMVENKPFSDVFLQVKLTDEQFDAICKIINKEQNGFLLDCYPEEYEIVEVIDYEDE